MNRSAEIWSALRRMGAAAALALALAPSTAAPLTFVFSGTLSSDAIDASRVGTDVTGMLRFDPAAAGHSATSAIEHLLSSRVGGWMSFEIRYAGGVLTTDRPEAPRQQGWAQILDEVPSGDGHRDQMNFRAEQEGAAFEYASYLGLVLDSRDTAFVDGFDFAQALDLSLLSASSHGWLRRHDERIDGTGAPLWLHDAQFTIDSFQLRTDDGVHRVPEPQTLALVLAALLPLVWRQRPIAAQATP